MADLLGVPGQAVAVQFKWKNNGSLPFQPQFRLALSRGGSWAESDWGDPSGEVAPGESSGGMIAMKGIPTDWNPGDVISVSLRAKCEGAFSEAEIGRWDNKISIPDIEADWIELIEPTLIVG